MGIPSYSTTPGNNNSPSPNGAPEGVAPGQINDIIRQVMADIRTQHESAQWIDYGHTPTKVDSDTFTVAGDQTAIYDAGRRLKFTGSVSGYATISSSSYSAPNTTVNVNSTAFTGTLTAVAVGIISGTNSAIPNYDGSFTATFGGGEFSSPLTGTISYRVSNGIVMLYAESNITGTSATTAMTLSGIPAAIRPSGTSKYVSSGRYMDNSIEVSAQAAINGIAGVITFAASVISGSRITRDTAGFTASGTKGILSGWCVSYPL